ncbi:MAG: hypothetical protein ACI376_04050 [Candidatus Bruticola sp.]
MIYTNAEMINSNCNNILPEPPKRQPLICATLLVGAQPEPLLSACLESAADAVDYIVVDLNGRYEENTAVLESSRFFKEKRMRISESVFTDYASARNHTFELLPPETSWVMRLDADEVHFPSDLEIITKEIIPHLSPNVGTLDAYWLCFFHSFKYVTKLERRHDLFVRYHKNMKWERSIHEQLSGRQGIRLAAPYVFHHYASIKDPVDFFRKAAFYTDLTQKEQSLGKLLERDVLSHIAKQDINDIDEKMAAYFKAEKNKIFAYKGQYPEVDIAIRQEATAPPYLKHMEDRLKEILGLNLQVQKGGKRRILFRLLPLLIHLNEFKARKQALLLADRLKKSLP